MMYVYAGSGEKNTQFKSNMQFSFGSYEWTLLKETGGEIPPSRDSHVVFAVHKRIYIFGGNSANTLLDDLWEFDPALLLYAYL
jgi:hypothetical protein